MAERKRTEDAGARRAGPPVTPDGRYFVVRGRLWRCSDPSLAPERRARLVHELMDARRAVGAAKRSGDRPAEVETRAAVDRAKRALGERGPAWWADGAPDLNRHMARNTPYAGWFTTLASQERMSFVSANETGTAAVADRGPVAGSDE